MKKSELEVEIKVPYYKLGEVDVKTRKIWIIFHGYAQLAEEFAHGFSRLLEPDTCLIFPQGLSKFYLKGVENKIGASWMTAHERETDIANYLVYLDQLYVREIKPYRPNISLNILGFSQGGHTASRWIHRSNIKYDKLVLWGVDLAKEIDKSAIKARFSHGINQVVVGDQDRFVSKEQLKQMSQRYSDIGFEYRLLAYQGKHEIDPEVVKLLI